MHGLYERLNGSPREVMCVTNEFPKHYVVFFSQNYPCGACLPQYLE